MESGCISQRAIPMQKFALFPLAEERHHAREPLPLMDLSNCGQSSPSLFLEPWSVADLKSFHEKAGEQAAPQPVPNLSTGSMDRYMCID
jgi:hypothetical protein